MRTIDPILTAALQSGAGKPILNVTLGTATGIVIYTKPAISYKLTGETLDVAFASDATDQVEAFWLTRGVEIDGVQYTETTGRFYVVGEEFPPGQMILHGELFPHQYYSAAGDLTYSQVITAFCSYFHKTAVFKDPAADWLNYQFFPTGKFIILNRASAFLPLLAQKYLIFCCDNGSDEILFYGCGPGMGAPDLAYVMTTDFARSLNDLHNRLYMWRDELGTVHTDGTATDPVHNLGFLPSTAIPPERHTVSWITECTVRPDLRIVDGDIFGVTYRALTVQNYALVTEQFTPPTRSSPHPRWFTHIESNPIFGNTAGGAMPSTIERVSNYTPLNTSMFNGILSAADNNLQACMDKLDDHNHTGGGASWGSITGTITAQADLMATFRQKLSGNRTYYVRTDGSDTNDGLANSAGGAFLTIQKAIDTVAALDISIYDVTIQIADGTYTGASVLKSIVGTGTVYIQGNAATPANVLISVANNHAFNGTNVQGLWYIKDLKIQVSSGTGILVLVSGASIYLRLANIVCGAPGAGYPHLYACNGAYIHTIGSYAISAGATNHACATTQGHIEGNLITITLAGTPGFVNFAQATMLGLVRNVGVTFAGTGATGARYSAATNGAIDTNGGGANYYPGNSAGSTATGGQYA